MNDIGTKPKGKLNLTEEKLNEINSDDTNTQNKFTHTQTNERTIRIFFSSRFSVVLICCCCLFVSCLLFDFVKWIFFTLRFSFLSFQYTYINLYTIYTLIPIFFFVCLNFGRLNWFCIFFSFLKFFSFVEYAYR